MTGPGKLARKAMAVVFLLGCAGAMANAATPQKASQAATPSSQARKQKPARTAAPAPPPPTPLDISYNDGLLSIAAKDARLRDVLTQLHEHTGVTIDGAIDANERVSADLGPGQAVLIVAALLEQTGYNFVITTAARDSRLLQSIQLTPKPSLLEELAPASLEEEGARVPAPPAANKEAKSKPRVVDDNGWTDVPPSPASPADKTAPPPK
jgi:hypothetical protein